MVETHKSELDDLRRKLEEASRLENRSMHMPRSMEEAEVQVSGVNLTCESHLLRSPVLRKRNTSPNSHKSGLNPMSSTCTCICGNTANKSKSMMEEEHEAYVQQVKE